MYAGDGFENADGLKQHAGGQCDVRLAAHHVDDPSGIGAPEKARMELPGGRIMMSAPVPRDRSAISPSTPLLTPTSVRIMVTCTPIAIALSRVRTGRCFRFSKTRRLTNY